MKSPISTFEELLNECNNSGINIEYGTLPNNINAVYYEDYETEPVITISNLLPTKCEQACVLAEELGHYHTSYGNILTDYNVSKIIINKQEYIAKKWAVKRLISIKNIIKAYDAGARNLFDMAEFLNVTEAFLKDAFKKYNSMYGKYKFRDNYIIYFDPPGVLKLF